MQRCVRVLGAVLLIAGGAIHLDLWRGGYEAIPYIGPLFLANVVASALVAVPLVVRGGRLALLGGAAVAVGSLAALVMSRTVGLLGFMEPGWTLDAMGTVAAELGVLVTLAFVVVLRAHSEDAVLVPALARSRATRDQGWL